MICQKVLTYWYQTQRFKYSHWLSKYCLFLAPLIPSVQRAIPCYDYKVSLSTSQSHQVQQCVQRWVKLKTVFFHQLQQEYTYKYNLYYSYVLFCSIKAIQPAQYNVMSKKKVLLYSLPLLISSSPTSNATPQAMLLPVII